MKKSALLILFLSLFFQSGLCQSYSPYYTQDEFDIASPGAYKYGLYGYVNPALLSMVDQPDLYFHIQ